MRSLAIRIVYFIGIAMSLMTLTLSYHNAAFWKDYNSILIRNAMLEFTFSAPGKSTQQQQSIINCIVDTPDVDAAAKCPSRWENEPYRNKSEEDLYRSIAIQVVQENTILQPTQKKHIVDCILNTSLSRSIHKCMPKPSQAPPSGGVFLHSPPVIGPRA